MARWSILSLFLAVISAPQPKISALPIPMWKHERLSKQDFCCPHTETERLKLDLYYQTVWPKRHPDVS